MSGFFTLSAFAVFASLTGASLTGASLADPETGPGGVIRQGACLPLERHVPDADVTHRPDPDVTLPPYGGEISSGQALIFLRLNTPAPVEIIPGWAVLDLETGEIRGTGALASAGETGHAGLYVPILCGPERQRPSITERDQNE